VSEDASGFDGAVNLGVLAHQRVNALAAVGWTVSEWPSAQIDFLLRSGVGSNLIFHLLLFCGAAFECVYMCALCLEALICAQFAILSRERSATPLEFSVLVLV